MTTPDTALQDLAQRLADKQAELEEARRAYDARLTDLTRQRAELQVQLRAVDAEIQGVGATAAPSAPPLPPPAIAAPPTTQALAGEAPSLPHLLVDLVRAAARPITVRELTDELVRAKFPTSSGNLIKMVSNKVGELVKRGLLHRAAGQPGVVLPPAEGGKLAATRAVPAAKVAPAASGAGRPTRKRDKESLRELLTRLLAKARRPLKAKELAEQALAAGYQTASKHFVNVVWVALGNMDNIENVANVGYRLQKPSGKAK